MIITLKIGKSYSITFPDIVGQRNAWRDAAIESSKRVREVMRENHMLGAELERTRDELKQYEARLRYARAMRVFK